VSAAWWAFAVGCTIPVEVGEYQPAPVWVGIEQDPDGDGVLRDVDCDDGDPEVGARPEVCDLRDNDCDGLTDEDEVCAVSELFELRGNVDLLIVVDASDEAADQRERFLWVLPGVLQPIFRDEITAQVAVVGANGTCQAVPWGTAQGEPFARSWTRDLADATRWVTEAIDALPGDMPARPLDVAHAAVRSSFGAHESFDRPRTKLALLFVTPGEDASELSPATVADDLGAYENGQWTAWALAPAGSPSCDGSPEAEAQFVVSPVQELILSEFGGGHLFDACRDEGATWMRRELADEGGLIAGAARTTFPLGHAFQPGSISVRHAVDGRSELVSDFIASGLTLTFPDPLPAEGVLRVEYDLAP